MKLTTEETSLDRIVFQLLTPQEATVIGARVPVTCKSVVSAQVEREGTYVKGFAFCAADDQFCAAKGMKIALEDAAAQIRSANLESPWTEVMKGRLRSLFMGDSDAVKKFNEEVKKRLFNPYKREKSAVVRDWTKRGRAHKVSL